MLAIALLTGCANDGARTHGPTVLVASSGSSTPSGFADSIELSAAATVAIGTSLVVDPSVLTVTVPGNPGEATLELTDERCSLRLIQDSASARGIPFTADDIQNSMAVVAFFHAVETPGQSLGLSWSVNKGEGILGAHSQIVVGDDGAQTLLLARGVGSISQLFYSELSCAPGVEVLEVYGRSVQPRVWIRVEW